MSTFHSGRDIFSSNHQMLKVKGISNIFRNTFWCKPFNETPLKISRRTHSILAWSVPFHGVYEHKNSVPIYDLKMCGKLFAHKKNPQKSLGVGSALILQKYASSTKIWPWPRPEKLIEGHCKGVNQCNYYVYQLF